MLADRGSEAATASDLTSIQNISGLPRRQARRSHPVYVKVIAAFLVCAGERMLRGQTASDSEQFRTSPRTEGPWRGMTYLQLAARALKGSRS
jgi:hypothetical protein